MALERPLSQRAARRRLPLFLLSAVRPPGGPAPPTSHRRLPPRPHLGWDRACDRRRPALSAGLARAPPVGPGARDVGLGGAPFGPRRLHDVPSAAHGCGRAPPPPPASRRRRGGSASGGTRRRAWSASPSAWACHCSPRFSG